MDLDVGGFDIETSIETRPTNSKDFSKRSLLGRRLVFAREATTKSKRARGLRKS